MPKVRKLTGNYIDMLKVLYPVMSSFYTSEEAFVTNYITASSAISETLLKDLGRDKFLSTNDRTYEEFVAAWMTPSTSAAYNQGNLTSSFFSLMLSLYINVDPRFETQPTAKGAPNRIEERIEYSHKNNNRYISLGYFDDEGIPCGICINYSTRDPNLWTISLIRNTNAEPKDREVLLISSAEILALNEDSLVNANNAEKAILDFLKSKMLSQQIKDCGLFTKNGTLNIAHANKLHAQHHTGSYLYGRHMVHKLEKQVVRMKQWQLTAQKFSLIKTALAEKREKNIQQLNSWKASWLYRPELETAGKQSFLRRNSGNVFATVAALVLLVGFALVLSGILAPLGITLIGTDFIVGAVSAGFAFTAALGSIVKIGANEQRLAEYQSELMRLEPTREIIYNQKLTNITTPTAIEELPEHEAMQAANFQNQLIQAVLHANFSEAEFAELEEQMKPAEPPVTEPAHNEDEMLFVGIDKAFDAQIHIVKELNEEDTALEREVDKAIQHGEHAKGMVIAAQEDHHQTNVVQTVEQTTSPAFETLITVR